MEITKINKRSFKGIFNPSDSDRAILRPFEGNKGCTLCSDNPKMVVSAKLCSARLDRGGEQSLCSGSQL